MSKQQALEQLEAELEYWAGVLRQHGVVKDRTYIFKNKIMRLSKEVARHE